MRHLFEPAADPLQVTYLVLPESSLMTVASAVDPLRAADRVSGRSLFRRRMVSVDGRAPQTTCGLPVAVAGAFDPQAVAPGSLLLVIAGFNAARHAGGPLLARIRAAARRAGGVGGIESGAWVLARARLLDGRAATTHWEDLEDFAAAHPAVRVRPDRWVVDGRVLTTGGASPTFDFMLHLIRSRCGYGVAIHVASVFSYDEAHAGTDAQPLVSLGRLAWHEPRVAAAIRAMEERLDAPVAVSTLAARSGVSARTLEKLFTATVGTTPGRFYQDLRLDAARRLVVDTRLPMTQVAVRTGFASASTFARAFRRRFGETALTLRARHARERAGPV